VSRKTEALIPQGLRKNSRQDCERKVVSGEWQVTSDERRAKGPAGGAGTRRREHGREILSLDIYQVELYLKASRLSRGKCECVGREMALRVPPWMLMAWVKAGRFSGKLAFSACHKMGKQSPPCKQVQGRRRQPQPEKSRAEYPQKHCKVKRTEVSLSQRLGRMRKSGVKNVA